MFCCETEQGPVDGRAGFFWMNGCNNAVKREIETLKYGYKQPSRHETPSLQPGERVGKKRVKAKDGKQIPSIPQEDSGRNILPALIKGAENLLVPLGLRRGN